MSSLNQVQLIGNIGNDPEFKTFDSGDRVCNLSLATSEKWKDKQSGEQKEKTDWHRISVTDQNLVKIIEQYVSKGSKLFVQGKLETRSWEQNGEKRYATEVCLRPYNGKIILLGGGSGNSSGNAQSSQHQQAKQDGHQADLGGDEIPF